MGAPEKKIKKIQTNSDNTYDIVPTMITDETGTYKATLPTLTKDETIMLKSDLSNVTNDKQVKAINSSTNNGLVAFSGTTGDSIKNTGVVISTATLSSSSTDSQIPTAKAIWDSMSSVVGPMSYKGTLGDEGTITELPTASSSNTGFVYKVITAGTYASQSAKIGDMFISTGSAWTLIPSGDDTGSILDVEVDGHSVVTNGIAEIATNSTYSATDNKIATMTDVNNVAIPEITITAAQMISSNVAQLTNEQYDILNNTKIVKIIMPDSSYMNLSKEFAPNNFFLGDEGETVNDYLYFDGIKNNYDISIEKVISYNYYVLVDKTSKYGIFISNKVPLVEKVNGKLGNVTLTPTDIGIPSYTSSEENYVLSVDSNGNLIWKAPYNGAASGS